MSFKDYIRNCTPSFLLKSYRWFKKKRVRRQLKKQAAEGRQLGVSQLMDNLRKLGIQAGDAVLVHCSMSKIGYLENGPQTIIDALLAVIGPSGHLMMPTSPNAGRQLDYIQKHKVFDVRYSPSALGAVTETFRTMPNVLRSLSPTEPVSAYGPRAEWITSGHFGEETPYTRNSPFYRLVELNGKILYIGVTLDNAGTSLHLLEDAVTDFKFPVYFHETFQVTIVDAEGREQSVKTKVHNPVFSAMRKCDLLLPRFEQSGVACKGKIGNANTWIFSAKEMFDSMLIGYREKGITMYTPNGEELIYDEK